jgi:hypothetical protein
MSRHLTHLDAISANAILQQRLAKHLVLQCVRNSRLEDLHAGIAPSSATGDYADVTVTSPFGPIPWPRVSRFNDEEMKQLMIDVVDRTYQFLQLLFDEHTGRELLGWLAEHDTVPKWNAPRHPEAPRHRP